MRVISTAQGNPGRRNIYEVFFFSFLFLLLIARLAGSLGLWRLDGMGYQFGMQAF